MISFFLPIRKGSKRIINKNFKSLPGYKFGLTELKIIQLKKFKNLSKKHFPNLDFEFVVSTNCKKVILYLKKYSWIKLHLRPNNLASDDSLDKLIKFVPKICVGNFVLWTHVTSPKFDHLEYLKFLKIFLRKSKTYKSAFSADKLQKFIFNNKKWISHVKSKKKWPRTQDLTPMYVANSAAFIASKKIYLNNADRICSNPLPIVSTDDKGMDIDDLKDFKRLKHLMLNDKKNKKNF